MRKQGTMTIRETINRLLSGGDRTENPEELTEIAVVPIGTGPMTVAALREAGFDATGAPTFNIVTDVASDYRILVPRREAAAATTRLGDLL
jgi:hypothetical protein